MGKRKCEGNKLTKSLWTFGSRDLGLRKNENPWTLLKPFGEGVISIWPLLHNGTAFGRQLGAPVRARPALTDLPSWTMKGGRGESGEGDQAPPAA